jgi:hypothetical protein
MKFTTIFAAIAATAIPVMAQNSNNSDSAVLNSATFFYNQNGSNFVTTLTAAEDTGDLFFRVSAPTAYDWWAIGIGAQMKGALMLIAYPSADGKCKFTTSSSRRVSN